MGDKPKFLSQEGLLYFWSQLKSLLANKVDKETGKGLTTNDFTNAYMTKLDGINASSTTPSPDGVGTVGVSGDYARADHVHPIVNGQGVCSTAMNTVNKTVEIQGFELVNGSIISVKFERGIYVDNATLNVNQTGAKPIYAVGSPIANNVVKNNDVCLFMYNGTSYNLLAIDSGRQKLYSDVIVYSDDRPNEYGITLGDTISHRYAGSFLKFGTNNWNDGIPLASSSTFGLMSSGDKIKLDGIEGDIDSAIQDALADITGFDFTIVQNLPVTGEKGVIYLIAHNHDVNDGYDEYIWINNGYEKLGHTDVDLSGYMETTDIITNTQIDTILGS